VVHPVKWWTPCVLLLVIVVVQAILFLAITQLATGLDVTPTMDETPTALYRVAKDAVVFVVLLVVLRRGGREPRATLRLKWVSPAKMGATCLMVLSLVPWEMFLWGDRGAERMMGLGDSIRFNAALVVSWMSGVFLTPVAEELFFRGFALSVFGKRSAVAGVLGSCVLFGTYHFSGSVASLIVPLPFALATAYSVVVTGSVYPAIVAHAFWNLLAVGADAGLTLPQPTPGWLLLSTVVGGICACLLLRTYRTCAQSR